MLPLESSVPVLERYGAEWARVEARFCFKAATPKTDPHRLGPDFKIHRDPLPFGSAPGYGGAISCDHQAFLSLAPDAVAIQATEASILTCSQKAGRLMSKSWCQSRPGLLPRQTG